MVCDKVVCEMVCDKVVCERRLCQRWCVTNMARERC